MKDRDRQSRAQVPAIATALDAEIPWQVAARLECLSLAVERRVAGDDTAKITAAAEEFYFWVTAVPVSAAKAPD